MAFLTFFTEIANSSMEKSIIFRKKNHFQLNFFFTHEMLARLIIASLFLTK